MAFIGQITGNIGRDPELKTLDMNGQPRIVAEFSLAVRQPRRQGIDQPTRWVKCTAWGRTAELITDFLKKGDKVFLVGRVETPELFKRRDGTDAVAERFTVEAWEKWSENPNTQAPDAAAQAAAPAPAPTQAAAQQPAAAPAYQQQPLTRPAAAPPQQATSAFV